MSWSVCARWENNEAWWREQALAQNPECGDQVDAAIAAVAALMAGDAIGGADKRYNVSMTGHANPGHETRVGRAHDFICVEVIQA